MLTPLPVVKIKSALKTKVDSNKLSQTHPMVWLNYQLFLRRLAKLAADKAKQEKSAVIHAHHIRQVTREALGSSKG